MASNMISLKWDHHSHTLVNGFASLRQNEAYCDATLTCAGRFYRVHRFVLSTCSEYLEQMFEEAKVCSPTTHPVIVLQNIKPEYLEALLNYMYVGEVSLPQSDIPELLKAAEYLNIKGLNAQGESLSINLEEGIQGKKRQRSAPTRQDKFRKRSGSSSSNESDLDSLSKQSSYVSIGSNQEMTPSVKEFEKLEDLVESDEISNQKENSYLEIKPGICINTIPDLPAQRTLQAQGKQSGRPKLALGHTYNNQGLSTIECLSENTLLRSVAICEGNKWLQSIHVPEVQHQSTSATNIQEVESEENLYASIRSIKSSTITNPSLPSAISNSSLGERPFVCPICKQGFGHKIVKTLHMFRYHNETPPLDSIHDADALLSDL